LFCHSWIVAVDFPLVNECFAIARTAQNTLP
jgi:hypothetical protein